MLDKKQIKCKKTSEVQKKDLLNTLQENLVEIIARFRRNRRRGRYFGETDEVIRIFGDFRSTG